MTDKAQELAILTAALTAAATSGLPMSGSSGKRGRYYKVLTEAERREKERKKKRKKMARKSRQRNR